MRHSVVRCNFNEIVTVLHKDNESHTLFEYILLEIFNLQNQGLKYYYHP